MWCRSGGLYRSKTAPWRSHLRTRQLLTALRLHAHTPTHTHSVIVGPQMGEGGFAFVYACVDAMDPSRRYVLKKILIQVRIYCMRTRHVGQ